MAGRDTARRCIIGLVLATLFTPQIDLQPADADSGTASLLSAEIGDASIAATGDAHEEFNRGLLWRISGATAEPSYLFGTMHVEDPRITQLPEPVIQAFDNSDSLTTESLLDVEQIIMVGTELLLDDGSTLEDLIGPGLYGEVTEALKTRGLLPQIAALLKPWAVAVLLSQPQAQNGMFLDRRLYELALQRGKQVFGLETLSEQLQIFNGMSIDDQIILLEETLAHINEIPEMIEQLTQAYVQRDLGLLAELANEQFALSEAHSRLKKELLIDRNMRMVERMVPRLSEGNAFIAIGALHLSGAAGLLNLLQQQGYILTRVY
jgi:hypothetical protein